MWTEKIAKTWFKSRPFLKDQKSAILEIFSVIKTIFWDWELIFNTKFFLTRKNSEKFKISKQILLLKKFNKYVVKKI